MSTQKLMIGNLSGTLILPENVRSNTPGILHIHGWGSSEDRYITRAEELAKLGYVNLTFNLPGHGTSKGDRNDLTRADYLKSTIEAYDFLAKYAQTISVVGASFGGYLGSILTSKRQIDSLVLRAPANYMDQGFSEIPHTLYYPNIGNQEWKNKALDFSSTLSLNSLHSFTGKILIIESEIDEVIPHQTIINYVNSNNLVKLVVMKDADHSIHNPKHLQEFTDLLIDWFN